MMFGKNNRGVKHLKRLLVSLVMVMILVITACGAEDEQAIDTIILADAGWDSIRIHNSITQIIIEEGYDYKTDITLGSTAATMQGLRDGDIHVYTEVWIDNMKELYEEVTSSGDVKRVSTNFSDIDQGLFVPTYVIEGDVERGIDPVAPDLKTVEDLKKYPHIFPDPENPNKGRIINAPSGWLTGDIIDIKFDLYGLDELYTNFKPGSDSALNASLVDAYEKGEPWVGNFWSPTTLSARFDLTLLQEPPYDETIWEESKATEFPPTDIVVAVHKDFPEQAPDVVKFLENYETSNDLTEAALRYMDEHDASPEETAVWWMVEYEDVWMRWVPEEVANKVKNAL